MWHSQLSIYTLLFIGFLHSDVNLQEILVLGDDTNSTNDELTISARDSIPIWTNQQLIVCFVSVSLGTLLFFVTFIVPAMIIIRRAKRDKNRLDLRELRRMSDFM